VPPLNSGVISPNHKNPKRAFAPKIPLIRGAYGPAMVRRTAPRHSCKNWSRHVRRRGEVGCRRIRVLVHKLQVGRGQCFYPRWRTDVSSPERRHVCCPDRRLPPSHAGTLIAVAPQRRWSHDRAMHLGKEPVDRATRASWPATSQPELSFFAASRSVDITSRCNGRERIVHTSSLRRPAAELGR
jgi:hypothetical protein